MENTVHEGRNIKRFREMLGIKQEALAFELGEGWTQKKVSQLEARERVEEELLAEVAKILNVSTEAIQRFSEESAINIIATTFNNHDQSNPQFASFINNSPTFNPLDKLIESYDENKKLYERLLEAEKERVAYLEKLLAAK